MSKKSSRKNMFDKFMAVSISTLVFCLFTAGYAMTLYDSVIAPIFVDESNTVTESNKNGINVSPSNTAKTETPPMDTEETKAETSPANTEESEAEEPSINIGSINAEHRDDPDYVTYNIDFTYAYYTDIVDGKEVKIPISNVTGGTISVPKASVNKDTDSDSKAEETEPENQTESDNQSHGGAWGGGNSWSDEGRYDNIKRPETKIVVDEDMLDD